MNDIAEQLDAPGAPLVPVGDLSKWLGLLDRVEVTGPVDIGLGLTWKPRGPMFVAAALCLYPSVVERDSGNSVMTRAHRALPVWQGEDAALAFIRQQVHDVYAHEADESIIVDGRRPFDPHPEVA